MSCFPHPYSVNKQHQLSFEPVNVRLHALTVLDDGHPAVRLRRSGVLVVHEVRNVATRPLALLLRYQQVGDLLAEVPYMPRFLHQLELERSLALLDAGVAVRGLVAVLVGCPATSG